MSSTRSSSLSSHLSHSRSTSTSTPTPSSSSLPTDSSTSPCYFRTDLEKSVLTSNFSLLRWSRCSPEVSHLARDWNFYWASVTTVKNIFNPDGGYRLGEGQLINHYPNHYELTRKDLMVKNIKKYRRDMENSSMLGEREADGTYKYLDFIPQTYLMPSDYSLFLEDFKRGTERERDRGNTNNGHSSSSSLSIDGYSASSLSSFPPPSAVGGGGVWIMKPNGKSQGSGIQIISKLSQIKRFAAQKLINPPTSARDNYVVSRYIENPLLIGGKKFDLRLYVLVTNYKPLRVYKYGEGFARFCNVKYSSNQSDLDNPYIHLTNVAIQKQGEEYNDKHGNKWSIHNLFMYLQAVYGEEATRQCEEQIDFIIVHSLKSVQNVLINDKHCFECYGYDLLLDSSLKPWLLEVNASPSLSVTTKPDKVLKTKLIHDLLQVVVPPGFPNHIPPLYASKGSSWNNALRVGGFRLLFDELLMENKGQWDKASAGGVAGERERGGNVSSGGGGGSREGSRNNVSIGEHISSRGFLGINNRANTPGNGTVNSSNNGRATGKWR